MSKSFSIKIKSPKPRSGVAVAAQHRNSAGPMKDKNERRSNEPTDWLDEYDDDELDHRPKFSPGEYPSCPEHVLDIMYDIALEKSVGTMKLPTGSL